MLVVEEQGVVGGVNSCRPRRRPPEPAAVAQGRKGLDGGESPVRAACRGCLSRRRPAPVGRPVRPDRELDRQGRRDEAVRAYRKSTHQDDASPLAFHNLGAIYAEEGRADEAIRAFEAALAIEQDAEGYQNLGLVHFAREDFARALDCFERSVECDPAFALGHYYAALCLMKSGIYADACLRFELAWKLDARLARIPYYRGTCLHKLERYEEARVSLEKALEFFPEDGRTHYQIALTCDALGMPQEERLHYSQARAARMA